MTHERKVRPLDFNLGIHIDEDPTEETDELADHQDFYSLRHRAEAVLGLLGITPPYRSETLHRVSHSLFLHALEGGSRLGIYNRDPGNESDFARKAPLATIGQYLVIPAEGIGYVAGMGAKSVSRRSVRKIVSLLDEHLIQDDASLSVDSQTV